MLDGLLYLHMVDDLQIDNQLDDGDIGSLDELNFMNLALVLEEPQVVVEPLHHLEQLILTSVRLAAVTSLLVLALQ